MHSAKYLIVNADDFGRSPGVNRGVIAAHVRGIVRSASLMVRWPAAREAVDLARQHSRLSLGLHVDLGEWACRDGEWFSLYEVVPLDDQVRVAHEIERQLDLFCQLVGRPPTHLDSHQHVHRESGIRTLCAQVAERLAVPLRHDGPDVRYCGDFYGQSKLGEPVPEWISSSALIAILSSLPPGITELACHPALASDVEGMYANERILEVATLCDPSVAAAITANGISLCSFADVSNLIGAVC